MNYNYFLSVIIALCVLASFIKVNRLNAEKDKNEAVAVIDQYLNRTDDKTDADENVLKDPEAILLASQKSSTETPNTASYSSKFNTMTDRYGNKTETRCFDSHPRLNCIMLITSPDGQQKAFVYGQNGDVKGLPENMFDRVATASPDEIANAAGIVLTPQRITTPTYVQSNKMEKLTPPLQPMSNSQPQPQIQNQNQSTEPPRTEAAREVKPTPDNSEKKTPPIDKNVFPKVNREIPNENRKPEEK